MPDTNVTQPPPANQTDTENKKSDSSFNIQAYNATVNIVRQRLQIIEKTKAELAQLKQMYDDIFINDAKYHQADKAVKEVMKKRTDIKTQLTRQPATMNIYIKIKDARQLLKENQQSLSQELMEYYRTSGVTEIEDERGNIQEFEIVVKLKPKRKT